MKKNNGLTLGIISLVISVVNAAVSLFAISNLPDEVPLHFDINWVCNGVGSPWTLFIISAFPLISSIIFLIILLAGKAKQPKITGITGLLITLYFVSVLWLVYPTFTSNVTIGDKIEPSGFVALLPLLVAVIMTVFGNYMPIIKPNGTIGIRISPTLKDEGCWRATHRFGGKVFVISGIIMALISLVWFIFKVRTYWLLYALYIIMLSVDIIVPCVYAFKYKKGSKN